VDDDDYVGTIDSLAAATEDTKSPDTSMGVSGSAPLSEEEVKPRFRLFADVSGYLHG
jgi:hypothetical protein